MIDLTKPPYNCDRFGIGDSTPGFQAALASGGSQKFYWPGGIYRLGPVTAPYGGVTIKGGGPGPTQLVPLDPANDFISILGQFVTIRDLMAQPQQPMTGGSLFKFELGNARLRDVVTIGGYDVVMFCADMHTCAGTGLRDC